MLNVCYPMTEAAEPGWQHFKESLLCPTSLFTVKCAQVIEWSNPFSPSPSVSISHFPPQFPAQEECAVIDDKSLQTALENFPFLMRKLVFSPLQTPSWAKQGSSAHFTAEPDNKMMINIGLHQRPITIPPLTLML